MWHKISLEKGFKTSKIKNVIDEPSVFVNGDSLDIKQKIHDALLMELVKQDDKGKYPNLMELARRGNFTVKFSVDLDGKGCADLVLTYPKRKTFGETNNGGLFIGESGPNATAFELITDVDFDAGKKLEQVNRYKRGFADVRVILPEEYQDYAKLFVTNHIVVHTWKGTRRWKCKHCEHITEVKDSSMAPNNCGSSQCKKTDLYFIGFRDDVQFK